MGLIPVPPGHVAAIVTHLEMRTRPAMRPPQSPSLTLVRWTAPAPDAYRALFKRVGAPWLWFSRLLLSDAALGAIIGHADVEVHVVRDPAGDDVGLVELDFRLAPDCEISFFGLIPECAGAGHGRWMMAETLALAWRPGIERVWVHTCTLDHASALGFYRAQGFVAYARSVETFADPRLSGALPADAAPQVPLVTRR
ncbi:MAG: GNAT family N-acetyltransferase [Sphingomonadaceae bacterium]